MKDRTLEAVHRQVEAMGVEVFEIGLFKPAAEGAVSVEPEMIPRTWDAATLLKSVPWLKYQNSLGRNIYIRPRGEHPLSMIDDLTDTALERMKAEGFQPCLIVETSPGNFQAWLNHGQVLPKAASTVAARLLAERFDGDKGCADWRHFGRLAGFTNRKEKYKQASGDFPFVRLTEASPSLVYSKSHSTIARARAEVEASANTTKSTRPQTFRRSGRILTIDHFRANPRYAGDGNRIDLAYATYAVSHGVPESDVAAAIMTRDLSKKGTARRQADYVNRTIKKAIARATGGTIVGPTPPIASALGSSHSFPASGRSR